MIIKPNWDKFKEKFIVIDNIFDCFQSTKFGTWYLKGTSFLKVLSLFGVILIAQVSAYFNFLQWSSKIDEQLNHSDGFMYVFWFILSFIVPDGNLFIIFISIVLLGIAIFFEYRKTNVKTIQETLLKPLKEKTKNILFQIKTNIPFDDQSIEIDRSSEINTIQEKLEQKQVIIICGDGGVGKTAIVKKLYSDENIFYVVKAIEFKEKDIFYGHNLQEFIDAHKEFKDKIFVIDSVEKLLDIEDRVFFKEFLSALIQNDWKIIFTTRTNYLDDLNYEFTETYNLNPCHITINNLSVDDLQKLSKTYNFTIPADEKLVNLILNPFYLNQFLQEYDGNNTENYLSFKTKLWNRLIFKSNPNREKCFLDLAYQRVNSGFFFVNMECKKSILKELVDDGILGYVTNGYFITHDIYEEWALEKIIEKEFTNREDEISFFKKIGTSLPIRRSFRDWVSDKLLLKDENINRFIEKVIENEDIEQFWKDEVLVSVLLSDYSDTFFDNFQQELLSADSTLLKRISFLLRIACKKADESPLEQYNLNIDSLTTFSMFNKPNGNGWKSFIKFVYEHMHILDIANSNIVIPVIGDWNKKQPNNDTTRFSTLLALNYYNKDYQSEEVIQVIIAGALTIEEELTSIFNIVIESKNVDRESRYYKLIKTIITEPTSIGMYKTIFRKPILELCDLFWFKRIQAQDNDMHGYHEKRYCLSDDYEFKYFPSDAYKTPIYWLLKEDMNETIDFILKFVNKVIECHTKQNQNNHTIEVKLNIDGEIIKQYHNIELWTTYRGRGNTTYLFESIHMALELFLLEQAKILDEYHLEILLKQILEKSTSSSISAIVGSIVLAHPDKTFNIALILFEEKEFIVSDTSRFSDETIGNFDLIQNYNNDVWHEIAIKQTNEYQHRNNNLEALFRNYQFFANKDMNEEIFQERQEKLWNLLDNHKKNIDTNDTTWRFCLGRIDRRTMSPTVEEHKDGQVISFNPKLDDDLIKKSKQTSDSLNERAKYLPLSLWSQYKFEHNDKYKEYSEYTENPKVVIAKIKEIMSLSEEDINQYHVIEEETPCTACCVLMRDYKKQLSEDEKGFCKNTLINIAKKDPEMSSSQIALNFLPYMIKDFEDQKIKTLVYDFLFIGYSVNFEIWDLSYEDALSLLIGYLVLRPEYLELRESKRKEFDKKNRFGHFDEVELLKSFNNDNELNLNKVIDNTIDISEIKNYESIDINTLMKAFEFMPNEASSVELKNISKNIILRVGSELLSDDKDNFNFQKVDNFLSKLSYIVLNLNQDEIEEYLFSFINGFNGGEIFSKLFLQLILAQDEVKKYDNFWYIWQLFEVKIIELCKDGDKYWYIDKIIKTYFLASSKYGNIWKQDSKNWLSLKEKDIKFLKNISVEIKHCPSVLYSISKLITDIGSPFLIRGIECISILIKDNQILLNEKLETNTIENIEILVRRHILNNIQQIKKERARKEEILVILNFLVEKGSAIGYMLRERVL